MNHVHGLEVIIVQKGAIFTNRMTRPAKHNYWKTFLVFSQFSSISMVYIKKKEVNETNKTVGYASDRKSSLLTLK